MLFILNLAGASQANGAMLSLLRTLEGYGFLGAVLGVQFLTPLGGQKQPPLKTGPQKLAPKNRPYIKLLIDSPDPKIHFLSEFLTLLKKRESIAILSRKKLPKSKENCQNVNQYSNLVTL